MLQHIIASFGQDCSKCSPSANKPLQRQSVTRVDVHTRTRECNHGMLVQYLIISLRLETGDSPPWAYACRKDPSAWCRSIAGPQYRAVPVILATPASVAAQ